MARIQLSLALSSFLHIPIPYILSSPRASARERVHAHTLTLRDTGDTGENIFKMNLSVHSLDNLSPTASSSSLSLLRTVKGLGHMNYGFKTGLLMLLDSIPCPRRILVDVDGLFQVQQLLMLCLFVSIVSQQRDFR